MAQVRQQIKATYPLPVYNYRVHIDDLTVGFSEVSGLHVEYEPVTYKHGLSFALGVKLIPGMAQPIKVSMKRGLTRAANGKFLLNWFQASYANPYQSPKKDIFVDLCDETGLATVRWAVRMALPTKYEAPTFDANSNEVAIETLEVIAHELQVDFNPSA